MVDLRAYEHHGNRTIKPGSSHSRTLRGVEPIYRNPDLGDLIEAPAGRILEGTRDRRGIRAMDGIAIAGNQAGAQATASQLWGREGPG